jgi:hypothetical protein
MEPSSTPFRRAGALLTISALTSLTLLQPVVARGFAGMGRVQAIRVVPRIPIQPKSVHREFVARPIAAPRNAFKNAFLQHRLHRQFFRGAAVGSSGPYGYPYAVDAGEQSAPALIAADEIGSPVLPYEQPACVPPVIIEIKPVHRAAHLPRVIYGRPPPC